MRVCISGARPKTMPVAIDTPSVKSSTSGSTVDFARARQARRIARMSALHADAREHEAEHAADDRQQHALGHELAQQPAAAGAERGAHRELAMPRLGARQQQVGEVGARDQQHERHRRLQHPDGAAGAADDLLLHRLHLQDVAAPGLACAPRPFGSGAEDVVLHADALAPVRDQRLSARSAPPLRRDAVLQAADEIEEVAAAILAIGRD